MTMEPTVKIEGGVVTIETTMEGAKALARAAFEYETYLEDNVETETIRFDGVNYNTHDLKMFMNLFPLRLFQARLNNYGIHNQVDG